MITTYHRPQSLDEALTLLNQPNRIPVGGGTLLARSTTDPVEVFDLQALSLDSINKSGNNLEIGATVTLQQLLESVHCPEALRAALKLEAPLNIRNTPTVAGTLVTCDARSTFATVLLALDAKIEIRNSPDDSRVSNIGEFLPLRPRGLITSVNRLLNYAVVVRPVRGVSADLEAGKALVNVSLRAPKNPFGAYLNFSAEFSQHGRDLELSGMQAGSLPLPSFLGSGVLWMAQRWLRQDPAYLALMDAMQRIAVTENHLSLDYRWRPELLTLVERKGAEVLVGVDEKQRLLVYADFARRTMGRYPAKSQQPVRELLAEVFGFARQGGGEAAAENRAAFTALGVYVAGVSLHQLLEGRGRSTRRAPAVLLTLHGRRDAAEHLLAAEVNEILELWMEL